MRFEGEFAVASTTERTRAVLLDVEGLASCVPGADDVQATGDGQHAGTVKMRLGPMSTAFELSGTLREGAESIQVDVRGRERLTGTLVEATFGSKVLADDAGSRVEWSLDVTLRGKLAQMGQAVFRDVARRITEQTVACVKQRIEASA